MIIKCLSGKFFPKTTKMTPPSTEERISVNEDPVKSLHFENEGGGGGCTLWFSIIVSTNSCSTKTIAPDSYESPPQKKKKKKKKERFNATDLF